jgi:hypothetical protein
MFFITFRRLRFLALRQLMATYMHRTGRKDSAMLHLPFEDRVEAGRLLARELSSRWPGRKGDAAVVLGLTRGGVPVAFAVADRLLLPLDVVVARKLGVPWQPELAMGAIAGSTQVLDKRAIGKLAITEQELNEVLERERAEMTRREELYRQARHCSTCTARRRSWSTTASPRAARWPLLFATYGVSVQPGLLLRYPWDRARL